MASLLTLARDISDQARRTGAASRALAGGLRIKLVWVAGQKVLRLSRDDGPPGAMEIQICRDAFDVPAGAERTDGERAVTLRWPSGGL